MRTSCCETGTEPHENLSLDDRVVLGYLSRDSLADLKDGKRLRVLKPENKPEDEYVQNGPSLHDYHGLG